MKIRTQLIAGLTIFALVLVVVSFLAATTNDEAGRIDRQRETVNTLALDIGELSYLTNDYTLFLEPQQEERWRAKFDEIDRSLTGITPETPEQQAIVENLKANLASMRLVFDDISGRASSPGNPTLPMVQLSWSRMAVQTQGMAFNARRLSDILEAKAIQLRTQNNFLILSLLGLFSGLLLTSYFLFYRRTLSSLSLLQDGAGIIGSGNLDHAITGTYDDEVGDLAQAFNRMTASLKSVTASKTDLEREMTERRQAEQALRESEMRYRTVADNTYDWEFWLDPEGKFLYCSPSCEMITGHTVAEFLADPDLRKRVIHPEDRAGYDEHLREVHDRREVGQAQWRYLRPDGTTCWVEHVCRPILGERGEFLGTRGSNRDITKRKMVEEALKISEGRFRALAEAMPQIVWSADATGAMDYYNPQALAYGGIPPEEAKGWNWESLIHPEDLPATLEAWRRALEDGTTSVIEHRLRRADGEYRWHLTRDAAVRDESGTVIRWIGTATDIHDMKLAEEALRESDERFRAVAFNTPDHILMQDRDLRYSLVINPQLGLTVEDMIGKTDFDFLTKEDAENLTGIKRQVLETGISIRVNVPATAKDGSIQHFEGSYIPKFDTQGSTVGLIGYFRNVTDRKKAEERISHLASFPELNPNPVLELSMAGEVIYVNPATTKILGELGLGKDPSLFLPRDIGTILPRILEGDVDEEVAVGRKVFLETITLNPSTRTIRIYAQNITELKQAEFNLRETSQYLENLINYANAPIIVWDPEFRITRFNHAFERLTGRTAREVMGKGLEILFPAGTITDSMEHIARTMTGERWETVEIPIVHNDGSIRTVLWNSATLFEADGRTVSSAIAQGQDITDRKQMEEELHATSQYLENLVNYANAPIIVWDPEFRITRFNQAFERLTGRASAEVLGKPIEILFPRAHAEASMDLIRKTMGGERWESVEIPILRRDAGVRTVLWNSAPLYEADGVTISSAIAQGQDITDRKQMVVEIAQKAAELAEANAVLSAEVSQRKRAEEAVRKTLSVLNAALESTADAMLATDKEGRITSYNRNFTTMWSIPDSILQTLDTRAATESISSQMRDPDAFLARIQEILDHPPRESYDMLELLDGRIIERYSKPQRIGNTIVGRVFSFRDITERKRAELQLIDSLNEKEVLLREIHHRVKNNLQLTTSLLDMTRMRTQDPGTAGILTDVMMKIQTMAQIHTRLYESRQFDRINMERQIRDQVQALTNIYARGDQEISTEIDTPEIYLPLDKAIPCALALNEILANAYKHAFKGRKKGTVHYLAREEDGHIRFTITDNGIGLPRGFDLGKANTLGLKLVRTLVEQQLKGTLSMRRNKGTEVIVHVPVGKEDHVEDSRR